MAQTTATAGAAPPHDAPRKRRMPHALVMMLLIIIAAAALTYLVPSGAYERTKAGQVVPGTFRTIPKDLGGALVRPRKSTDSLAYAASPVSIVKIGRAHV